MRELRVGSFPYRVALALAAWNGPTAHAQPPVHAVVSGDDKALTAALAAHLTDSGRYQVITGAPPDCGDRAACWRIALDGRGLDQAVFVDRVDETLVGVRVIGTDGAQRKATATLGEALDAATIDGLFFGPATLHLVGAPMGTRVVVDARLALRVDGDGWIRNLPSGKHAIELSAAGRSPRFVAVMLVPGAVIDINAGLAIATSARKPFPTVATLGVAVLAAGAIAVASSVDAPGVARSVR